MSQAEHLPRQERDILDAVLENTHAHLAYLDREFNFVLVNSAYVLGSSHSREELLGRNYFEMFPDAETQAIFEQVRDTGRGVRFYTKPFQRADQPELGVTYWDWTLAPVIDPTGETQGLVFSLLDVTERVRAEEGLLESHAELERRVQERTGDLSRANVLLSQEIDERKQAEGALRQERDFVTGLIDTVQAIILVLDPQGRIVRINPYMETLSGYALKQVQGRDWFSTFLPEQDRDRIRQVFQSALRHAPTRGNVNSIVTAEGRELQIEWYDSTLRDREGKVTGLLAVGHDITDRLRAEAALRKHLEELHALNELSAQVSASLSPQQVVEAALEGVGRSVAPDLSMIYLREGEDLRLQGVRAADPALQEISPPIKQVGRCLCGLAVAEGRAYYSSDILLDPRCTRPECKAAGIHSFAALPLRKGAEVLGVLGVASLRLRDFGQTAPFLEALAGAVAIGLQNALLHHELRQRATDLEIEIAERRRAEEHVRYQAALVENVSDAIISTDLSFRILSWNRAAERMYGWSGGEVLGRPASEVLKSRYPHHHSAQVTDQFQAQGRWEGEVIQERKDGTPIHALAAMSAILDSAGERVGTVSINRDISERVRAEATLRRRVEELNALNEFGTLVSASLSLEQVTEASLSGIAAHVAPDLSILYLQRGDRLLLQGTHALDPELEDVNLGVERVGQCLCGLAAQEGKAVYSSDLFVDSRCTVDACRIAGIRSFAALPLQRGTEVLGVLGLASTQRRDWRPVAPFLETLAGHVAASLQNALLHKELRQRTVEGRSLQSDPGGP